MVNFDYSQAANSLSPSAADFIFLLFPLSTFNSITIEPQNYFMALTAFELESA